MTGAERQQSVDGPLACYYAGNAALRPQCTLTATVRLGAVVPCAPCNAARSNLSKGQRPVPIPAGRQVDVLAWIATAEWPASAAQTNLAATVTRAHQAGASWTAIEPSSASHAKAHNNALRASTHESTNWVTRAH